MAPQPQLTPTLAALRDQLLALERADGPALAAALAAPITFDDVRGFVRFDDDSYVRALIFRNDRLELRLHCWRPGQSTSLHGHGASACAFKILRGTATETVLGDRDRVWAPGSIVEENAPRLHQVMNAGRDPLLTLHAYSPPLPVDAPSSRSGRQVVDRRRRLRRRGGRLPPAARDGRRRAHPPGRDGTVAGPRDRLRRRERGLSTERPGVAHEHRSGGAGRLRDVLGQRSGAARVPGRARSTRGTSRRASPPRVKSSAAKMRLWRDEAVAVTRDAVVLRGGATLPADVVILATGIVPRVKHAHPASTRASSTRGTSARSRRCRWARKGGCCCSARACPRWTCSRSSTRRDSPARSPWSRRAGSCRCRTSPSSRGRRRLSADDVGARADGASPARALGARDDRVGGGRRHALAARGRQSASAHHPPLPVAAARAIAASFVRHVRPYWDVFRHRAPGGRSRARRRLDARRPVATDRRPGDDRRPRRRVVG